MNILVVGSGGREHAIVWKIAKSRRVKKIYCAPGNPGIAQLAECVDIKADDISGLRDLAIREKIDLTIVGPEVPLTLGIVDSFEDKGLKVFGPLKKAAEIEGSKIFAKNLMQKYGIPTGGYKVFKDSREAKEYIKEHSYPLVVKADGLAAGKGVIICKTKEDALDAIKLIMEKKVFGRAGDRVIIEEFLKGEEASFLAITDGKTVIPLPPCQDHKAVFDGDRGPNTGGMGAYSPTPIITPKLKEDIMDNIMVPTIKAMGKEGRPYKGVLYAGLMITGNGPMVLEFNCRFGDPETQPIMMRLKNDLVDVLLSAVEGKLNKIKLKCDNKFALCVVMAAKGYPGGYEKGKEIKGIDDASRLNDIVVFHACTALNDSKLVTAGGRVLGVTAMGVGVKRAINKAYEAVSRIKWEGVHYRKDIGEKAIR
ncbi:MAG: phosphoribosylamine--glycine ligase [Deltaproteobacteria bacterium GWC2_42_51]|nr:MAG: phosphoribosylamine--glycine ligase [Deltaproteobacteria bacterium GWB2_42_7]OGP31837.1 MAG: phosphoribosylamine--glycine ligase [Deltaproteobacteria bacterium GWC2_42_51]OGP38055.1 MAG: phosphoribosylamine--glycine ligase [Deltaproteobacteria bacterium GWD2_42_10]OGP47609.1 MAG: phosphoribosylamine--glycine ligase [Deltaproteobacteria bacterium GWF2_42_12]OGQ30315.1 MAG: phosphoribosylamine--glycine ligase [Deltaproteobacteria bacterium RIFCSPHIGHO2_02_FULL_42_44]OGQ35641.1 MAG: phosp